MTTAATHTLTRHGDTREYRFTPQADGTVRVKLWGEKACSFQQTLTRDAARAEWVRLTRIGYAAW